MNLADITYKECPTCGAEATSESKRDRHTNGHWNEERIFACGCCVSYSPNFSREGIPILCPKHEDVIAEKDLKREAITKLLDFLSTLKMDLDFRERMIENIKLLRY